MLMVVHHRKVIWVAVWKLKRMFAMKFLIEKNHTYNRFVRVEVMFANHSSSSTFRFHGNHCDVRRPVMD